MNLVDYVILSEFDIDKGSVVRLQYPSPVPGVEPGIIASYMLPEGAHNRLQDMTYFILNRRKGETVGEVVQRL